jgi:hypothetical protein
MDLDKTATDVTKEGTSTGAAQNAGIEEAASSAGGAPIAAEASSSETLVSPELEAKILSFVSGAIASNPQLLGVGDAIAANAKQASDEIAEMHKALALELANQIDAAKADILAHMTPLVTALVAGQKPQPQLVPAPPAAAVGDAHAIVAGDPVKVWADPEHEKFRLGSVVAVHDAGHAFDVELDDGTVTKVVADGLAFDDRR